jgi:hypothetical protein
MTPMMLVQAMMDVPMNGESARLATNSSVMIMAPLIPTTNSYSMVEG